MAVDLRTTATFRVSDDPAARAELRELISRRLIDRHDLPAAEADAMNLGALLGRVLNVGDERWLRARTTAYRGWKVAITELSADYADAETDSRTCSQCGPGHDSGDGTCARHGKLVRHG